MRSTTVEAVLAKIINEVRSGDLDSQTASKLGYLANILAGTIEDGRLEELEERMNQWEADHG